MHVYHLTDVGEIFPPAITHLYYGRYLATVQQDGTVLCNNHKYVVDNNERLSPGEPVMIWSDHDFYCCPTAEYELLHHH